MVALIRRVALAVAMVPLLAFATGCASMNPYDYQIEPPLDLLTDPNPVGPEDVDVVTVVMLPPKNSSGRRWDGLASQLAADVRDTVLSAANVEFRAQGPEMDAIVQELARQGTALYSPQGTVELGRLANSKYVLTVELTAASASRESYWIEVVDWFAPRDRDGRQPTKRELRWKVQADTSASVQLVSVETGKVMWSANRSVHDSEELHERDPGTTGEANLARRLAGTLVPQLVGGVIQLFPVQGYIVELRGSQQFALLNFGGRKIDRGAIISAMGVHTENDPVRGIRNVEIEVASLQGLMTDGRGTWAYNRGKAGVLRRGMKVVVTGVAERDAGTSDFFRWLSVMIP